MGNKTAGKALFLSLILSLFLVACGGPAPVTTDDDDRCQTYGYIPVCDLVLRYYRQHNGVELFGYPITRQMDRDGMRLQYFEKAIIQYPAVANPHTASTASTVSSTGSIATRSKQQKLSDRLLKPAIASRFYCTRISGCYLCGICLS